ncbi:GMC family oxidoreductase [Myxococcota bacterium]|nr:GMC family oxidoreductase [Myxococcota bacterium]
MIFDVSTLPLPLVIRTDLCVVGSGAGGMTAAAIAAEAGVETVVLEAGEYLTPKDMSQREEEMLPRLLWDNGGRATRDFGVKVHQGRGVGGSTLHNLNLVKRIPRAIRARWHRDGVAMTVEAWDALYDEVERLLAVSPIPEDQVSRHNQLFDEGRRALGWRGGGLAHNRTGCLGSGFCELGCAYNAKNNAAKVFLPRLVAARGQVLTMCQATHLLVEGDAVVGVEAVALDRATRQPIGRVEIRASRVCLSGSATGTAALLLRSGIEDPSDRTGNGLRVHPALVAAGEYDEEIRAWSGIPQSVECTEFLDLESEDEAAPRVWLITAFAHPAGLATMAPGHGETHRAFMRKYANLGAFTGMIHDETEGRVRPSGALGLTIDYWPDETDRRQLLLGLWAAAKLHFAAGARRVSIPTFPTPTTLEAGDDVDALKRWTLERGRMDVTAVHPMSTVPMNEDPRRAPVDSRGRHHHVKNLWVADGSLFPTSIGVPPQLSIYAMGLAVGRALVKG